MVLLSATVTPILGQQKPNIIILLSDDMGFTDLGCYGGEIKTPNLDRLASQGIRFTQFYNASRSCPIRASLLTGLYPHQAGIGAMVSDSHLPGYRGDLGKDCVTIAEVLKKAGYTNYMAGKWHVTLCPYGKEMLKASKHNWPLQRGFDHFYGTIQGAFNYWDPSSLVRDNQFISPFDDPLYKPKDPYYYTTAISDQATHYIKEHTSKKPFFMYVAYTAAHWPMQAPENEIDAYNGIYDQGYEPIRKARFAKAKALGVIKNNIELSEQAGDWKKTPHKKWESRLMQTYAAMVTHMDRGIGQIINTLKEEGKFDNTLIIFLQDNGGCSETTGRKDLPVNHPLKGPVMRKSDFQSYGRKYLRDGSIVKTGPSSMPGPANTFIGYGKNWANVSNTPFREYKKYVHEGGISTPLIASWPKGIQAKGELRNTPCHIIDLMATCIEVAKAPYPSINKGIKIQPYEGQSLIPIFKKDRTHNRTFFFEHMGNAALRQGDWKLVGKDKVSTTGVATTGWELFNMADDRSEQHNLIDKYPQKAAELLNLFKQEAKRVKAIPSPLKP